MGKSRFMMEITGELGEYWKEHAQKDVANAVSMAEKDAIVESDGAVRWASNGSYLMDDLCEKLEYGGFKFSREATCMKRAAEVSESIRRYRTNATCPFTDEEKAEMEANFEPGQTVVDVINGRRYTVCGRA